VRRANYFLDKLSVGGTPPLVHEDVVFEPDIKQIWLIRIPDRVSAPRRTHFQLLRSALLRTTG